MPSPLFARQLWTSLRGWWREHTRENGVVSTSALLVGEFWDFLRDSTPERRRRRYGDMEYDWKYHVNTTSGTVGWRERLLGVFLSGYQPTEPAAFQEMMASLPIDFREFTFVDLGSGKGRTLLMASEYPFRRIVGVEILPELNRAALENIHDYKSASRRCARIESICADAREFELPQEPLLLYLFNPLPARALSEVLQRLGKSLVEAPRTVWVVYHNPQLETMLSGSGFLQKAGGTPQYSVYRPSGGSASPARAHIRTSPGHRGN